MPDACSSGGGSAPRAMAPCSRVKWCQPGMESMQCQIIRPRFPRFANDAKRWSANTCVPRPAQRGPRDPSRRRRRDRRVRPARHSQRPLRGVPPTGESFRCLRVALLFVEKDRIVSERGLLRLGHDPAPTRPRRRIRLIRNRRQMSLTYHSEAILSPSERRNCRFGSSRWPHTTRLISARCKRLPRDCHGSRSV